MFLGPRQVCRVQNCTKSTLLGDKIAIADTSLTRLVGLLGKRKLPVGGGLLIMPSQGVHTLGMMFPIDVLFLDHEFRVRSARERLMPFRVTSLDFNAYSVLELPAGTIALSTTVAGDELSFEPPLG